MSATRSIENATSTDIQEFDSSPSIKPVLNITKKFSVMKKEMAEGMIVQDKGKENNKFLSINSSY